MENRDVFECFSLNEALSCLWKPDLCDPADEDEEAADEGDPTPKYDNS